VQTWMKRCLGALAGLVLALPARAQMFGLGYSSLFGISATYGSVNDVSHSFNFDGFKPSEWTVSFDYRIEHAALLRLTYGSMWTEQSQSGQTVTTPEGPVFVPSAKEHVNYITADASYLYSEGFYTGGVFGGIGGYQYKPEAMPAGFEQFQDPNQKFFGFNFGVDGEFRVARGFSLLLRLTYHYITASPARQFFNADAGVVARF
jgi:hypothetical protein